MKVMVNLLTSPTISPAATTADSPDRHDKSDAAAYVAAEYYGKRTMWLLVVVTSLWDIVVTFDKHFALSGQLLTGRLL